ncbi:N-acetylmannosamine-6-phosphate 2-epimerase [Leifsonia bigeumensis]|uniref:Putative N-acetylmannosamine-6-phosphate 2-epimerase n=1 Tax=Leifsonella bigeumensis TaxID=433643 RepID=A0ABP7EZ48_9MICO
MSTGILESLRGGLIVSCQAYPGEPLRDPAILRQLALAVVEGGAVAVRLEGLTTVRFAAEVVDVPIIGIVKEGRGPVVITPTVDRALELARAGADIVAVDGTRRSRPDGLGLREVVERLHGEAGVLVMADCGSLQDALAAEAAGADLLGTTLAGYSGERALTRGPDLELVRELASECGSPIVAEGRIRTPHEAQAALLAGAFAVCVGTAITHPASITRDFVDGLQAG